MQVAKLTNRGVVRVSGADAADWLQDLITNDIARADEASACFAALLTPQGKVLFDFLLQRRGEDFLLDCAANHAGALAKRLSMYRLRAKVSISDSSAEFAVFAVWDSTGQPAIDARRDPRHPELGWRIISDPDNPGVDTNSSLDAYSVFRIGLGVPEGGSDFSYGELFPHDVNMDELHGVDFRKGCYVGQEVVSRVHHRGTARKRVRKLLLPSPAPAPGTDILAGETTIGQVIAVAGNTGLGLVRIDRVAESLEAGAATRAGGGAVDIKL